ncbi:MAG: hypothetical protein FWH57_04170 [Oscillospiraceae bacterium]|nr:hypothetical protein [Oscillospiraceae bacterium]
MSLNADNKHENNDKEKNTKENISTNRSEGSKRQIPRWVTVFAPIAAAAVVVAIVVFLFKPNSVDDSVDQSKFALHYTVVPNDNPRIKVLSISIRMDINKLSSERMIYMYKSGILSPILYCADENGNTIETDETTDLLAIGPINTASKRVTIRYDVVVGSTLNYIQTYGDFYEDLLVFTGERVMMIPYLSYSQLKQAYKYVSSISFNLESNYDWTAIIPYQEPMSENCSFYVEKPTWGDFSAISRSSYCFGQFEKQDMGAGSAVYFDKAIAGNGQILSMEALTTFVSYYENLFGSLTTDAPLVMLRNATENNAAILGGVGARGAAVSLEVNAADELQTMSSTLYHLFFDSKIKAPNLRYPPNSWLYSGLANYHVLKSGTHLSQELINMYSMNVIDEPDMDYLDYLYFSIKEPGFLALNPSMEGNMDEAEGAYYMDIKVPVMIDLIEYAISNTGDAGFIGALIDMASEEKELNIEKFMKAKCGSYFEAVTRCFSGNAILPNYNSFKLDGRVSDEDITLHLTNTDTTLANLYSHGHGYIGYISFPLFLLNTDVFYIDAEALDISYSTEEIQTEIEEFSSTLHQYLMQYAMFAKLAGYDELTYENVKSMYTENNFNIWMEYCENVGFKDS